MYEKLLLRQQKAATRILVTGDRNWSNVTLIRQALEESDSVQTVIEGGATGADSIAAEIAGWLGLEVLEYPANWKKYGKSAGPQRNRQMIKEGKPNFVLAFHNDLRESKGTRDMVIAARQAKIPVRVISESGSFI